jgi:hypothetical protein
MGRGLRRGRQRRQQGEKEEGEEFCRFHDFRLPRADTTLSLEQNAF